MQTYLDNNIDFYSDSFAFTTYNVTWLYKNPQAQQYFKIKSMSGC